MITTLFPITHFSFMNEIYVHALKLLARRDYSTRRLCDRLEQQFENVPGNVIEHLTSGGYLDDRRFAENFVRSRKRRGRLQLQADLERHGVPEDIIREAIESENWPSAGDILKTKMKALKLDPPLRQKDAARLSRSLERLGYDAEDILRELENFL